MRIEGDEAKLAIAKMKQKRKSRCRYGNWRVKKETMRWGTERREMGGPKEGEIDDGAEKKWQL